MREDRLSGAYPEGFTQPHQHFRPQVADGRSLRRTEPVIGRSLIAGSPMLNRRKAHAQPARKFPFIDEVLIG